MEDLDVLSGKALKPKDNNINKKYTDKEADVIYIDSDDDEESQTSSFNSDQMIFEYPLEKSVHESVHVYKKGLECLAPTQFLNDMIIDFWMKYILMERLCEEDRDNSFVFSSLFYNSLCNSKTNGDGWTRRINPFAKRFIFVPIIEESHWVMAVICFPGSVNQVTSSSSTTLAPRNKITWHKSTGSSTQATPPINPSKATFHNLKSSDTSSTSVCESPQDKRKRALREKRFQKLNLDVLYEKPRTCTQPKKRQKLAEEGTQMNPMILIFDSFNEFGINRVKIFEKLRFFLNAEWKKRNVDTQLIFTGQNMPGVTVKVPQQQNSYDCGIYILQYFEYFYLHPIKSFKTPLASLNRWFDEQKIEGKREEIFQTILQILKDQYPDRISLLPEDFLTQLDQEHNQVFTRSDSSDDKCLESPPHLSPDLFENYVDEEEEELRRIYSPPSTSKSRIVNTKKRDLSLSPSPPVLQKYDDHDFTISSSNSEAYAADNSSSSSDSYVPLLSPGLEQHYRQEDVDEDSTATDDKDSTATDDEVISLNDSGSDSREDRDRDRDCRRMNSRQLEYPVNLYSSRSSTQENSPEIGTNSSKSVKQLFYYPELEDY